MLVNLLWVDVEDLFEYARKNRRPSGIQRLAYEIYCTLQKQYGGSGMVRFVRHHPTRNSFREVEWAEVAALFHELVASEPAPGRSLPSGILPHSPARQLVRRAAQRLPTSLRVTLVDALVAQQVALQAWANCLVETARCSLQGLSRLPRRLRRGQRGAATTKQGISVSASAADDFDSIAGPGDVLLTLGSPWWHASYAALVGKYRTQRGMRYALMVYDLIPLVRPEWCDRGLVRLFRAWFSSVLPLCDHVFAISRATAADVEAYAQQHDILLPRPVMPIPVGSGFSTTGSAAPVQPTERLPPPGSYALIVSTIEVRKNHLLLFRIWRRLLEELPRDRVPTLVFAGRIGWMVEDLMHQIANTDNLGGKLMIIENPTDEELHSLYAGCRFTLFPSLYEGWGLPVTESLALGKPCFISNRTSLPEAGGHLARSFDPENLQGAYAMIRQVLEDPDVLQQWEDMVKRQFRPVPWSATVTALLAGLDHALANVPSCDPALAGRGSAGTADAAAA